MAVKPADFREIDCKVCANLDFGFSMAFQTIADIEQEEFQPHIIKLDMDIAVIGEDIETRGELDMLRDKGSGKFQGYYFARPAIEQLPAVNFVS